jgi:tetratricopeptide (TPR) repeat protein
VVGISAENDTPPEWLDTASAEPAPLLSPDEVPSQGPAATGELFRSGDLLVRHIAGHHSACCVVTFDSFTDYRSLDRPGFGEHFFAGAGIDAIHVIPRDNHWYQYADMAEAMARVREAASRYARVVTYGSSMGAYAAIRLAGLAGAHAVLALSPQYSIDPVIVPWERRWPDSSARFRSVWERRLPFDAPAATYVVYDPADNDRRHIALLARRFDFHKIGIPGGGHPVTGYLNDVALLRETVLAVCHGTFDPEAFGREALARRPRSAQYLLTQTKGTSHRRRHERVAVMREAYRLAPENPGIVSRLGVVLALAGQFEEALAMHRRALELAPDHPNLLQNQSFSLEASGDLRGALAVMERLDAQTGGAAMYQARLARLRARIRWTESLWGRGAARLRRFSRAVAEAVRRAWPSRTPPPAGSRR